jgi:hypothetical protein
MRFPLPSIPSHKGRGVVRTQRFINRDLGILLTGIEYLAVRKTY